MSLVKYLVTAGVVGIALAGTACSDKATAQTKNAVDRTKVLAGDLSEKSAAAASSTGAEVSDGWITTKIKAKFADEIALEGSKISVETDDHVVSLRGTVLSDAGKARALAIAHGTERVTRVVDLLVVE